MDPFSLPLLQRYGGLFSLFVAFGMLVAVCIYVFILILLKWIVLGRTVPGKYHIHSAYGLRFALVQSWCTGPLPNIFCVFFANTAISNIALKGLGAKLGRRVSISKLSSLMLAGCDQINVGDSTVLDYDCALLGAHIDGDVLVIKPIHVGSSAFIADGALVMPGCSLGKGALISVRSLIPKSAKLAEGSVWHGSPALCLDPGLHGRQASMETQFYFSMRQMVLRKKESLERDDDESEVLSGWGSTVLKMVPKMGRRSTKKQSFVKSPDAFSMGSLLADEVQRSKGSFLDGLLALTVPIVFVPLWIFVSIFGPVELFFFIEDSYSRVLAACLLPVILLFVGK